MISSPVMISFTNHISRFFNINPYTVSQYSHSSKFASCRGGDFCCRSGVVFDDNSGTLLHTLKIIMIAVFGDLLNGSYELWKGMRRLKWHDWIYQEVFNRRKAASKEHKKPVEGQNLGTGSRLDRFQTIRFSGTSCDHMTVKSMFTLG